MPGKVNPVIPEAVAQSAIKVMGNDVIITQACSSGNLELNQFMPLIAHSLLENLQLLTNSCEIFRELCVNGLKANEAVCRKQVENSTAVVTALIPEIGYKKASEIVKVASERKISIKKAALQLQYIDEIRFAELITPEAVCRLGN